MSEKRRPLTGAVLLERWAAREREHPCSDLCPVCHQDVRVVGLTHLAYTFETCRCGKPEYPHLVETLWHRACLEPIRCASFSPARVRGSKGKPGHDSLWCQCCGRLEQSHPSAR